MNLQGLLTQFEGNAATLMMGAAMHYATAGHVDTKHLDADALAIGATGMLSQVEAEHPGIAAKYGWVKIDDAVGLSKALNAAMGATPPSGLQ